MAGRVVLVAGIGRGLGLASAVALAELGADIAFADMDGAIVEEAAAAVEEVGRRPLAAALNVEDSAAFRKFVVEIESRFGRIDVLINNIGGTGKRSFLETEEARWDKLLSRNLRGFLVCTQVVAKAMVDRGAGGSIINVTMGHRVAPNYAIYGAAKAAVEHFSRTMALELGPSGIRVNVVAPSAVLTPNIRKLIPPGQEAVMASRIPLGRTGLPEDVVGTMVYLASDLSKWVTGNTLYVGGGAHLAEGWVHDLSAGWLQGAAR